MGDDEQREKKSFFLLLARYSQLGLTLPAATFVGWLVGAALDRWLHTKGFYLVGLLLGSVAGFVELIRAVISDDSKLVFCLGQPDCRSYSSTLYPFPMF